MTHEKIQLWPFIICISQETELESAEFNSEDSHEKVIHWWHWGHFHAFIVQVSLRDRASGWHVVLLVWWSSKGNFSLTLEKVLALYIKYIGLLGVNMIVLLEDCLEKAIFPRRQTFKLILWFHLEDGLEKAVNQWHWCKASGRQIRLDWYVSFTQKMVSKGHQWHFGSLGSASLLFRSPGRHSFELVK